jgi:hypothetical protein
MQQDMAARWRLHHKLTSSFANFNRRYDHTPQKGLGIFRALFEYHKLTISHNGCTATTLLNAPERTSINTACTSLYRSDLHKMWR